MMYGIVKNAQGQVTGQHAVDPTAPGGIQGQMTQIATAQGTFGAPSGRRPVAPPQGPRPVAPPQGPRPVVPQRGPGPAVPQRGVQPAQVFLRFHIRLPNGQAQLVTRAIQLSPAMGVPPGVYALQDQR